MKISLLVAILFLTIFSVETGLQNNFPSLDHYIIRAFKRMINLTRNAYFEKRIINEIQTLKMAIKREKHLLRLKVENEIYLKFLVTNSSIFKDFLTMRFLK
jgi:hypothetical protein